MKRHDKYRRLRGLRAEFNLTQLQLALKTKLSQTRISLIENGYGDPSADERAVIAKAFNLAEADVFPETETAVAS